MSAGSAPPLLVLHPPGDRRGGRPWRDGLVTSPWPSPVFAPDLPGHGEAEPPLGGNLELSDGAIVGSQVDTGPTPVVVGIGDSGWSAQVLALGGRASALVLVDGLGAPWLDPAERVASTRRHLRQLLADRAALEPRTPHAPDARLDHPPPPLGDRALVQRALEATTVPVLVLASPGAAATITESRQLVDELASNTTPIDVAELADTAPSSVTAIVAAWWLNR